MDKFVQFTGTPETGGPTTVMDYFDGNTVTALWNYAQNFSMNDNSYGTVTGPSTPGALNLIAGQTHGASPENPDGWYDHAMPPNVNQSQTPYDVFAGTNQSGTNPPLGGYQGRFGYGPRLPLLIISPFAKQNFVDHSISDQSSILRFIEDNWKLGRIGDSSFDELAGSLETVFDFDTERHARRLILDPTTGERAQPCARDGWE